MGLGLVKLPPAVRGSQGGKSHIPPNLCLFSHVCGFRGGEYEFPALSVLQNLPDLDTMDLDEDEVCMKVSPSSLAYSVCLDQDVNLDGYML